MTLEIQSRKEKDVVVVTPCGRLTLEHGSLLHDEVRRMVAGGVRQVLIDLSSVDYIDSHGLGQMVACHTTLRRHQGWLRFTGMSQKVLRLVEMAGFPRVLQFDPDLATALGKLSGS